MGAGPQREGGIVFVTWEDDSQAFDKGDLVALDASGEIYRASGETWVTDEPTTRRTFVSKFLGVASQNKAAGEDVVVNAGDAAGKLRVSHVGVYKFAPSAGTYLIGSWVGPEKAAGNALLDTTVQLVTDPDEAIGFVVGGEGVNPTEIEVQIVSRKARVPSNVGYSAGAGGAVTQATNSSTGVTLNKATGQITTVALTTAAAAEERFTVTNSQVAATDVVALSTTYNGAGTPMLGVVNVTAGSFDVVITNLHASAAFNAAMVINFVVLKGRTA